MIQSEKKYIIDGWAVEIVVDVLRNLKAQIERNQKIYTKDEFLNVIDSYDFAIGYLINLKLNEVQSDIYSKEDMPEDLKALLKKMQIKLDNTKGKENGTESLEK